MRLIRKFLCNVLDWHSPNTICVGEVNTRSICKYCGRYIIQDSQGNWFTPYMERKK